MLVAVLGAIFAAAIIIPTQLDSYARRWTVRALRERYESDVSIKQLDIVSVFPRVRIHAVGVLLRYHNRPDMPPLASIEDLSAEGSLLGFLRSPRHLGSVELKGLDINVTHGEGPRQTPDAKRGKKRKRHLYPFVIDQLRADGTDLRVFPRDPNKPHHGFRIYKLFMRSAGLGQAMSFEATLSNPTPPGMIESNGSFGPWQAENPGATAVSGTYTLRHADLSVFHGIAGILSSAGRYSGVLDRIEVQGKTDTPDFSIKSSGNRVHLSTEFKAIVDGTDGNTLLQPVNAHFLSTTLICKGGVVGRKGTPGKTVSLDVQSAGTRLEDLVRISAKGDPPISGDVDLHTKLVIPPGEQDVDEKMMLDGQFKVEQAEFDSHEVQQKLAGLSRRALGKPNAPLNLHVASGFRARFKLTRSVMTFPSASFSIPGAVVMLHGSFGLKSEQMNFDGALRLHAKVSQMTTGLKSLLLKPLDPILSRKGAGTLLPLHITGTRAHPEFKVDIRKAIFGGK